MTDERMALLELVETGLAARAKHGVQLVNVARMRDGHHERSPREADHALNRALVVALRGSAIAVFEDVVALQRRKEVAALARAVTEDLRYGQA